MFELNDHVRLRHAIDRYPVGSEGTIVEVFTKPVGYVVEMGHGLDRVIDCFEDDLELV